MAEHGWPAEQVILAARRGDVESIAVLVHGSHPHVRRFARSLCASPEDAEDAAQEAMIVLYRRIGTLRATGALASWMFRIVRNECLRRARPARRSPRVEVDPVVPSPEEEVFQRLEAERVARVVAALPADQRGVLILRDVQGLPGRVVADVLGLSQAAMKSRLHRARAAVRRELADGGGAAVEGRDG